MGTKNGWRWLAAVTITAASLSACSDTSTAPPLSALTAVTKPSFDLNSAVAHTPVMGELRMCESATSEAGGTYEVEGTPVGASTGTVHNPVNLAIGECRTAAIDGDGANAGLSVTAHEIGEETDGTITECLEAGIDGVKSCMPTSESSAHFVNSFHGVLITYRNVVPQEDVVALFVIGDVEPHGINDVVNFWGAQWWKNNSMSGVVSNGVASFKGYATEAGTCGGTWVSRPGNSSDPPDKIPDQVAVIVTTKVLKQGPNISGDIKQIVLVNQDGGYGPAPGHRGNGPVARVLCNAP